MIIDPAGAQRTGDNSWVFRIVEPEDIERALTEYVKIWQDLGVEWDRVEAVFNQHEYIELNMDIDAFVKWLYKQANNIVPQTKLTLKTPYYFSSKYLLAHYLKHNLCCNRK